jgi:guanylate kinase
MIVLVGKTATGKNTIRDKLVDMGFKPVITYTTRPIRDNEIEEMTYHYVSDNWFVEKEKEGFFIETTSYTVATGDVWRYGTSKYGLSNESVIILNPEGLKKIKQLGIDVTSFLIVADENTIWNRLRQRGDAADEARRRLNADDEDFKDITEYIDYAIRNEDEGVDDVVSIINYLYERKGAND